MKSTRPENDVTCTQHTLAVTLSPTDPTVYHVVGFLCSQGSPQGKTLQFVVHGATYDHNYWDWPLEPEKYSYVRKATDAGYAIFNIDRIGTGLSDHPNDALVTLQSNTFVVHQLVQDLRHGVIGNTSFSKIILVGHSLGSAISVFEAYTYSDVDGVILTGFLHQVNPAAPPIYAADIYPASQDPKFANSGYSPGYITTVPRKRGELFYNLPGADLAAIALDETLKQTQTSEELTTTFDAFAPTISQQIHVPVFLAVGQNDLFVCGTDLSCEDSSAILSREALDWGPQACLEAFVLPNAGHSIN